MRGLVLGALDEVDRDFVRADVEARGQRRRDRPGRIATLFETTLEGMHLDEGPASIR